MQISSHKFSSLLLGLAMVGVALFGQPAHAAGPATRIVVTPATVGLTADQTSTLTVTAIDAGGVSTDVTGASVFTTNDPRGSFTGATYNAGKVGVWTIGVKAEGFNASVVVTVTAGKLAELQINPNSAPERVALGTNRTYTVEGFDADNNPVAVTDATWSVTKELGTLSTKGVFTPKAEGKGTITATSGEVKGSVALEVYERPAVVLGPLTNANANNTANSNSNANGNTNSSINDNTNTGVVDTSDAGTCSARKNWAWGLILLALLGGTALLYAFVNVTKIWPAAVALGVAAILAVLEHRYGCGSAWWSWVAILGTAALTGFAYQQAPKQE